MATEKVMASTTLVPPDIENRPLRLINYEPALPGIS